MAYEVKISQKYFSVLRRIAWGYDASVHDTLHKVIDDWVSQNDTRFICELCKDQSFCHFCSMKKSSATGHKE